MPAVKYTPTLLAGLGVSAAKVAAVHSKLGKDKGKSSASATSGEVSDASTVSSTRWSRKAKTEDSDGSTVSVSSTPETKKKLAPKKKEKKETVVSSKATPKGGSKGGKPATKPRPP